MHVALTVNAGKSLWNHRKQRRARLGVLVALSMAWPAACSPEDPGPSPGADLKETVASIVERGWNEGEVQVLASTMADPVVFHYAGSGREMTREQMGGVVLRWREAFPDLRMEVEELISEGDLVAGRFTLSGTHERTWNGVPPTGRRVSMALTMFFRFEDGRVVELWESDDQLGFRRQLGMIESGGTRFDS